MQVPEEKLAEYIRDSGLVSERDVTEALREGTEAGVSIGDILLGNDLLSEEDLRSITASVLGIPFVDLKRREIGIDVFSLIPEPASRNNNIVAFNKTPAGVEVAMLNIDALETVRDLCHRRGIKLLPRLTDSESMKFALMQYQRLLRETFGDVIKENVNLLPSDDDADGANDAVVAIVDALIKHAILQDVSDIHFEPMEDGTLVRYRIGGVLYDAMALPKRALRGIVERIKILAQLDPRIREEPSDGRFRIISGDDRVGVRVSTFPTHYGEKVVLRLLREPASGFTLESLGFHGDGLERIHRVIREPAGLILVSGTGKSGVTTTLYTLLDILNTPGVSIATIEEQIEYRIPRVSQTHIRPEHNLTFASGLRFLARQDADIIMVGDIADKETAELAVTTALRGRLVVAGLSASSAANAALALGKLGASRALVSRALKLVINQRLVGILAGDKKGYIPSEKDMELLGKHASFKTIVKRLKEEGIVSHDSVIDSLAFHRANANSLTKDGYDGETSIAEVMEVSPAIGQLVADGARENSITKQAREEGMLTLFEDGIFKAAQGITTIEAVQRAAGK